MKFTLPPVKRWLLFALATFFCYVVTAVTIFFIGYKFGASAAVMRISAVMQDILLFIFPAILTAMLITRLPATFLAVDRRPGASATVWGICALLLSIPAMNAIIAWNEALTLPAALKPLEDAMRAAEDAARNSMALLTGQHTILALVVNILIVAVLAAFSEELFFRGTLQRLLSTSRINIHVAVWAAAIVFSAFHMQFFGFVPRMLLGAFFGYALVWTGSLWTPVILHALNNTIYLIGEYFYPATASDAAPSLTSGVLPWPYILASVILTASALFVMHRTTRRSNSFCQSR